MDNVVYRRNDYIITKVSNGYIVINTKKDFKDGHTHLRSFNAAKTAIDLSIKKKIPRSTDFYYLRSLIRISKDKEYQEKIQELIDVRIQKGKKQNYIIK